MYSSLSHDEIVEKMFEKKDPVKSGAFLKPGVGAVVLNDEGQILLEKRQDCGLWGLLGGKMDVGESLLEGLHREIFEESGLKVKVLHLLGIYSGADRVVTYLDNGDVAQLLDMIFVVQPMSKELSISEESLELKYFSPDQLPFEQLTPFSFDPLQDFIKNRSFVIS